MQLVGVERERIVEMMHVATKWMSQAFALALGTNSS